MPQPEPTPTVIRGTDHADRLRGTPGDDVIEGGESGQGDVIRGLAGDDTIRIVNGGRVFAGPGDDTVRGVYLFTRSLIDCGPGADHLYLTDTTQQYVVVHNCEKVTITPVE